MIDFCSVFIIHSAIKQTGYKLDSHIQLRITRSSLFLVQRFDINHDTCTMHKTDHHASYLVVYTVLSHPVYPVLSHPISLNSCHLSKPRFGKSSLTDFLKPKDKILQSPHIRQYTSYIVKVITHITPNEKYELGLCNGHWIEIN